MIFSRYCYCYLIKSKDETFNKFKIYKSEVANQQEENKTLRTDRGGEYTLNDFFLFRQEHRIIHEVLLTLHNPTIWLSIKAIPSWI